MREFVYSLISDMHLDHPQNKTPYANLEKNVVIAGDTANGLLGLKFFNKLKNKGFTLFPVDGNHEHYSNVNQGRSVQETTDRFRQDYPPRIDIDDTLTILLVCGWYRVEDPVFWTNYMNDCRRAFGPDCYTAAHEVNLRAFEDAEFIRDTIKAEPNRRFIVVTHVSPCTETLDLRYEGNDGNAFYWNPLMRETLAECKDSILIWHHGHTHVSRDEIVDGVRVVSNPRGYPGENKSWAPLTLRIEY